MEAQAICTFSERTETEHLVEFHGPGVATPKLDAEEMDKHVARLVEMTKRPLREKIYWVRGPLLGQSRMALLGLAIGSAESPSDWKTADHPHNLSVDRHELAHAVLHQHYKPDTDPPTLLVEGWAESQAGPSSGQLASWALDSRRIHVEGMKRNVRHSYLRELVRPFWYHHIDGPVYSVGGAFVDFLLRKHGVDKFLTLYFSCREDTFEARCQEVFMVDFDELERQFWEEAQTLAAHARD
jgi:hypothetical protein